MWFFVKICLLVIISLVPVYYSDAQNSPQDYLEGHNGIRAQVEVGQMTWDKTLASYALNYAHSRKGDCKHVRSNGPYGENLAIGNSSGVMPGFTGVDAVTMWMREKMNYDYGSNSCLAGTLCGNYTQLVWKTSTKLGCARTACKTRGFWYVICSYDPPGNRRGHRPY